MMVTSCAVDALCMAPGPIEAKETLPTRTFHATVLDCFFFRNQVLVVVVEGDREFSRWHTEHSLCTGPYVSGVSKRVRLLCPD